MHRFREGEEVDYAIVGVGAGGGVLLQRLARAGFRVLGFDAGPFWDPDADDALLAALRSGLRATEKRRLIELPHHINDRAFAHALAAQFREIA